MIDKFITRHSDLCSCPQCIERCPSMTVNEWLEILCVNPYTGFQLAQDKTKYPKTPIPINTVNPCDSLVFETALQGGSVAGRKDILRAILRADEEFFNIAGYWPSRAQMRDEVYFKHGLNINSSHMIRLDSPMVEALGMYRNSEVADGAILTSDPAKSQFLDDNNDGLIDTIRLTYLDSANIFPTQDCLDEVAVYMDKAKCKELCEFQVRDLCVSKDMNTGIITIDIPSWTLIDPKLYEGFAQVPLDPNDLDNYVGELFVVRRWVDPSLAIVAKRKNVSCACGNNGDCYTCVGLEACILHAGRGMIEIRPSKKGENNCCQQCFSHFCINYIAGGCDDHHIIAHLAASYLKRQICCIKNTEIDYWQQDFLGLDSRDRVTTSLEGKEKSNQLGTMRGQIDAWRYLRRRRIVKAFRI